MKCKHQKMHIKKEVKIETNLPIFTVNSKEDLANIEVKKGEEVFIKCEKASIIKELDGCYEIVGIFKKIFYKIYRRI